MRRICITNNRAKSSSYDTVIKKTDWTHPFDFVVQNTALACKQVNAATWVGYTVMSTSCTWWAAWAWDSNVKQRLTTWSDGCNYIGYNNNPAWNPCWNGITFTINDSRVNYQWVDWGFNSNPTNGGVWYVR